MALSGALQEKLDQLYGVLRSYQRVALAFSGGVDSSLLLKCSLDALGADNVLVLHGRSELQKEAESELAMGWLGRHGLADGVATQALELQPLDWQEFVKNPADRCYLCKLRVYTLFFGFAEKWGAQVLLDGTNTDDLQDTRPGFRAIKELGVKTPFVAAGFSKAEIRQLSHEFVLDTWDRPSSSCLATRVPAGLEITREHLGKIETWETFLLGLDFKGCRARISAENPETVYVSIEEKDYERFLARLTRLGLIKFFQSQGIKKVYLDMIGR